jgi:hypothetical protein
MSTTLQLDKTQGGAASREKEREKKRITMKKNMQIFY